MVTSASVGSQGQGHGGHVTVSGQVTTDLLTRGGKDIAFSDYCPLWRGHRRLVHASFGLFGEGSARLQDMGELLLLLFPVPSRSRRSSFKPFLLQSWRPSTTSLRSCCPAGGVAWTRLPPSPGP